MIINIIFVFFFSKFRGKVVGCLVVVIAVANMLIYILKTHSFLEETAEA